MDDGAVEEAEGGSVVTRTDPWAIEPAGLTVLRVDEPADVALSVAESLGAELVIPGEDLEEVLGQRRDAVSERAIARQAVAVFDQIDAKATPELHVIADTDELRRLVERLRRAEVVVQDTHLEVKRRFGAEQSSNLAVHPDTIRKSATELLGARAAVDKITAELEAVSQEAAVDEHPDPWGDDGVDLSGADAFGATIDEEAERKLASGRFGRTRTKSKPAALPAGDRRSKAVRKEVVLRGVASVVAATLVAVLVSVGGLVNPLAFVLPVLGVIYAVGLVRDQREDDADRTVAGDYLAAVGAITDQAYGGGVESLRPADEPVEAVADGPTMMLRARLQSATARLAQTEREWASLVGVEADPGDIDAVLRTRDAQYQLSDAQLHATPSVRAAARYERRIRAKWKAAWAAIDRTPPPLDQAGHAIDGLEAEGIFAITIEKYRGVVDGDQERSAQLARYDELANGRQVSVVRAEANEPLRAVVIADEAGEVVDSELEAMLDGTDELQVVLVRS